MVSDKRLFMTLCLVVWFINTSMTGRFTLPTVWAGLYVTVVSVPVWALIGSFLSGASVFLFRLARVDITKSLNLWQKADIGLALAVVLKPAFGIPL
jgi:hypothetical protein